MVVIFRRKIFDRWQKLLIIALMLTTSVHTSASFEDFKIEVSKPTFVLPQFTGAFREREASIAPEEYETAERLRELLDSGKKDEVLKELEVFYDIELSPAMQTLKAQIYFSLQMYDKAEKTYLAVLQRKPELVRAHSDLAQLYLITENPEKARHHFARSVALGSNEAIIHGQLAYLNLTMYGPYSAISEYQQAMALEPENMQWQQGLLAALSRAHMYDAAAALLQEILARNPGESDLWLSQATLALRRNDNRQALASLEMAMLLGDENETNLRTAAQLHLQLQSYDRALTLLQTHLQNSDFNMATLNEYLTWMGQAGMWQQASSLLNSAENRLQSLPTAEQSRFYYHRARVSNALGNTKDSDQFYTLSLEKNPGNGQALLDYARFNTEQKNFTKAELLYIRAEAIAEVEKHALLGRSQLYLDTKDYKSALIHLRNAYNKFPELYELKDNIEIIENIIRSEKPLN